MQFTATNELIWIDGTHLTGHLADGPGHRVLSSAPVAPEPSCQCWLVVQIRSGQWRETRVPDR